MSTRKVLEWMFIAIGILFFLWIAELVLGIAFGLVSLSFSLIGGLLSLLFSKAGLTLLVVGLIAYIIMNNRREGRAQYRY
jgi:predicted Co/Zn/Cd cation transporter (cation efflux family)